MVFWKRWRVGILGTVGYGSGVWCAYNLVMILCLDESFFNPSAIPSHYVGVYMGEGASLYQSPIAMSTVKQICGVIALDQGCSIDYVLSPYGHFCFWHLPFLIHMQPCLSVLNSQE